VFFDGFDDVPAALQTFWKSHHVTAFDGNHVAFFRCDYGLAFNDVAGLGFVVFPVKLGNIFFPQRPVLDI
jgi:hypothetical protein